MSQPTRRPDPTVPPGATTTRDLPEPMSLRRMVGPGVVAVGIGMAAGEIILWPYLTATCAASVVTQLYSMLLVRLNACDLPTAVRIGGWRLGGLLVAIGFYGFFAVAMVITQLQKL